MSDSDTTSLPPSSLKRKVSEGPSDTNSIPPSSFERTVSSSSTDMPPVAKGVKKTRGANATVRRPRDPSAVQPLAPPSIHSATSPPMPAVRRIQRFLRRYKNATTQKIVALFLGGGPTIEKVKSISFEHLVVFLREKHIIAISKACLQRIHLLCTFRHGTLCRTLAPENVNVRVFLAAFMIAYRSTHVFEGMGQLEQSLLESAIPLLERFQQICDSLRKGDPPVGFAGVSETLTREFPEMLFEYLKRFKAWKVPDEAKLILRIKHALLALYQAQEHLPPVESEESNLRAEFSAQIDRLRSKFRQIAGADALAAFDEQRRSGRYPVSGGDGGGGDGDGGGDGNGGGCAYAALPGRMTNEQLAHELLLDPTFQLDEHGGPNSSENPTFYRIRETFHNAFWNSLVDDLTLGRPCYIRVIRVLAEIRDGINDLAGSRSSGNITEIVDLDFIQTQADKGLYCWDSCMRLIGSIVEVVQLVQAPARDQQTKDKWKEVKVAMEKAAADAADQPRSFCRALEFLLDRVNAMRIDAANARLRLIAPVLRDHGTDYERGKLADKIKDGSLTLERTEDWISKTMKQEIAANTADLQKLLDGNSQEFIRIHSAAMLALVADGSPIKAETCPETLLLDVHRLGLLQAEFRYIVLASAMLITIGHGLAATRKASDAQLIGTISETFVSDARTEIDVEQTVADIGKTLEQSSLTPEARDDVRRKLLQCASPSDAVHQLLATRIRAFWSRIDEDGNVPADTQILSSAKTLIPRIDKAATKLRKLTALNRIVHLPHLNRIIGEEATKIKDARAVMS